MGKGKQPKGKGSDLHTVSRKGQVRLSSDLKRSVCRICNTVLIPGRTATQRIENESRGGKKPWADVLVIECTLCGSKKRFPVGAQRQKKKAERECARAPPEILNKNADEQPALVSAIQTTTDQSSAPG
ncbi:hypothetical protein N0V90_005359 [Kalmusia sp. IMI 367209]|nr:hypothetical protein N0V90_005359 [Kalmusia sp. IMI 367209]